MEGRVDILKHNGAGAPYFVVNKAALLGYVELQRDAQYDFGRLYSVLNVSNLSRGDSFILLSYGCELPYGFEFIAINVTGSYQPNLMNFSYIDNNIEKPVPEHGALVYPMGANYEINHGGWFDFPKTLVSSTNYCLAINDLNRFKLRVSMYNVPDDLDGKIFFAPFWIKIAHTSPLIP
jgi:hypothetical protein